MKKMFLKYGGVIFFYTAIIVMIVAVNYHFTNLEPEQLENLAYVTQE